MNAQVKETSQALLPIESINAVEVFKDRGKLDELLTRIRAATATLVPDVTTEAGRKLIASTAYKVARSKTAIDDAGKDLVEGWKKQAKVVDAERKHARDTLDALKDEIRAPLDEWEAEEERKEQALIEEARIRREEEEATRLADIERREAEVREREERAAAAERAEAERLAVEKAEAERVEREERIRQEAQEAAQREADEAVATAQRQAQEAEERQRAQAEQAERDRIAAAEQAERDRVQAVADAEQRVRDAAAVIERERLVREESQRVEDERRAASQNHRRAINRKALAALVQNNVDETEGKRIIELIATGKVPAVSIQY
jgi:hypothetical protein